MRKLFSLFLALVATTSLWAHDFEVDGIYYNYLDNNNVEVTYRGNYYDSYEEYAGEVIIPSTVTYNGTTYSVTSIGYGAFYHCSSLTSINIPNSVTSIGSSAFYDCSSLTSITIPNRVTEIGWEAFWSCSSLTSMVVAEGNTVFDSRENCNAIIHTATNNLVAGCQNTIIPNSVTSIGDYAFSGCSSLTSITIPESVNSIGEGVFVGCSSLTSMVVDGSNTTYDSRNNCNAIIETATNTLIAGCQNTIIPNGVTNIGKHAFRGCASLTSITIPNSVTSIGDNAFRSCSSFNTIYLEATTPPTLLGANVFTTTPLTCYIPCGTQATYEASAWASQVSEFVEEGCVDPTWQILYTSTDGEMVAPYTSDVFGANMVSNEYKDGQGVITFDGPVTSIGDMAFFSCDSLTSITIPNSVKSIGDWGFNNCSSLTSITIGNSVTSIGNFAFRYCTSLTSITIPNSVTSIGDLAFRYCTSLTSITIPNSVTSIGDTAFYNCSSLTSIAIPNSVTNIGGGAFMDCPSLISMMVENGNTIYDSRENSNAIIETASNTLIAGCQNTIIPHSITSIGGDAFYNCGFLTSITIPNSVTSIGDRAFFSCDSLTSVTIGNSVKKIGDSAFAGCSSLTSVTIPNSVTRIGEAAFYHCDSLTSVTIGNSVTSIGTWAFYNCSFTSITCEATTPPTLGSWAFSANKSIPVHVPCGCVSAYKAANGWKDFTNIQEPSINSIEVYTSNSQMGSAKVDYNNCAGNQITATANYGYHFVQWSDGNIDNPRTITLTQDTVLTAEFALTTAGQCGKNLYWVYDTYTTTLTITGSGDMYNERPWGLLAKDIAKVLLPYGITHIGNDAFRECLNLREITIPATVTTIGDQSFAGCRNLRNINCYPLLPPYAETTSFANYNVNLNVPCDYLEDYQYDIVFGSFKYINCMSSDEVEDAEDVEIDAGTTDVTIIWPTKENAYTYTIVIKKNGQVVCTLVFDAFGRLLNISFAPGRDGNHPAQYAEAVASGGFRFTVTGLEEGTDYTYDITTTDESDNTLAIHSGEFTTQSNTPTAIEHTNGLSSKTNCYKIIRDNQLIIIRDGKTYNAMGKEL